MARKYNEAVEEINQSIRWMEQQKADFSTERTSIEIDSGLSNADLDKLLGMSNEGV